MINVKSLIQLKAFARQDGALLSLLWISSFAATTLAPASSLGNLLAIATPFFVGWRLTLFRNEALDGAISFRRGYGYVVYTFFYASLIFALAQALYFMYLDNGAFAGMLTEAAATLTPFYKQSGLSQQEIDATMNMMLSMKPLHWALMFMFQNILIGFCLGAPIALLCRRKPSQPVQNI